MVDHWGLAWNVCGIKDALFRWNRANRWRGLRLCSDVANGPQSKVALVRWTKFDLMKKVGVWHRYLSLKTVDVDAF